MSLQERSTLTGWSIFGHVSEDAEHGGRTGGRIAFHAGRWADRFEEGLPLRLADGRTKATLLTMGVGDDESREGCGCSSEFYGTTMGGIKRSTLPQLSPAAHCDSWEIEGAMHSAIGLGHPANALRRFIRTSHFRTLSHDDQNWIRKIMRGWKRCDGPMDEAEWCQQAEGLLETIEKHLARARAKAAEAEVETPAVKTSPKPERKARRQRQHSGLVFVRGSHRGKERYECRRGSKLFIWDRKLDEQPVADRSYDCVEVATVAKGRLIVLAVKPL
jgi:hypothetical protein